LALAASDYKGTDFWLMFNRNYASTPELYLFLSGETATTGEVSVPGEAVPRSFTITPGTVTTITIPASVMATTTDGVSATAIHVTAEAEIFVYGLNRYQSTTDAFLGLPTDILGTEYLVMSYPGLSSTYGSLFGVVASEDATQVSVTLRADSNGHTAGVPYTVMLSRGQAYQIITDTNADLTGTLVTADKPVAVFGGTRCANIPTSYGACDHLVEELTPTQAWGREFVTMPLATRLNGDTFRVLADQDGTSVSINGTVVATLDRGQFHEQIIEGPATISASGPVLVAQFSNGTDYDDVTSDPFMMLIPPYEQFVASYNITTPPSGFDINYVNVVAPDGAVGAVQVDGVALPAESFTSIGLSGFSGTQVALDPGSHTLTGPLPFGAFVYGFARADSYGYAGGMSVSPVATVAGVTLTGGTIQQTETQLCVTATVRDTLAAAVNGVRVDFSVSGANPATGFADTDSTGEALFCYTGTSAGEDTIVATVGIFSDQTSTTWTAAPSVAGISLTGATATPTTGTELCVGAAVLDSLDNPMEGETVAFTVLRSPPTPAAWRGSATPAATPARTPSWPRWARSPASSSPPGPRPSRRPCRAMARAAVPWGRSVCCWRHPACSGLVAGGSRGAVAQPSAPRWRACSPSPPLTPRRATGTRR